MDIKGKYVGAGALNRGGVTRCKVVEGLQRPEVLWWRKIVSVIVSFFSAMYVIKWKEFFPGKELIRPPCFDGRAVCYPSSNILRDYLTWRQVDCHINNQYNTCFWMLVKSGKTKSAAQERLQHTQTREKNDLLKNDFGIDYNELPLMFRRGSSVFRKDENRRLGVRRSTDASWNDIVVEHCNIIDESFWHEHPYILGDTEALERARVGR